MEAISNRLRSKEVILDCDDSDNKTVWYIRALSDEVDEFLQDSLVEITPDNITRYRNVRVQNMIVQFGVYDFRGFVDEKGNQIKPKYSMDFTLGGSDGVKKLSRETLELIPQRARNELSSKIIALTRLGEIEKKSWNLTTESSTNTDENQLTVVETKQNVTAETNVGSSEKLV